MSDTRGYWINKDQRAERAKKHAQDMHVKYKLAIWRSVKNTELYDVDFQCSKNIEKKDMKITICDMDTISAAILFEFNAEGKVAVLNFASYKNPGGQFLKGSRAQEESICHESFLYNVLVKFPLYYEWNNANKNKALYLNRGLYSPNVYIVREKDYVAEVNVITCAAPNKSAAQKYCKVTNEENSIALRSRIKFMLDIAKENEVHTLILGAWGCGVFGQDAYEVARIFKEFLETTHKCFGHVIFAIPDGMNNHLEAFKSVFDD